MNKRIFKSILLIVLVFSFMMILEVTSNAASLTVSPTTVNVGENFSVNIAGIPDEVYGLQCNINVEGSGCDPEIFIKADDNMKPVTFTAKKAGTFTISVSGMQAYKEDRSPIDVAVSNSSIVVKDSTPQPPVEEKKLTDIAISTKPNKTTYTEGETFDKTGMVVTATYSDGSKKAVSGYSHSPSSALKTSDKQITVSYSEGGVSKTATQAITVNAKQQNTNTNTNANTNTNNTTPKNNTVANNTVEPTVVNPTFKDVYEKVYAVNACNVRSSCSTATTNNKIGSLEKDELVIRTGVSSEWSRILFNGKTAYVASKLLTTTAPEEDNEEENEVENEISNELETIKSEVGVLPEVGNNISVQLFFVTCSLSVAIISGFLYMKIKEK